MNMKKVIMLKTATCTKCGMIEKMVGKIEDIDLVKLDAVHDREGVQLASKFGIKSVPAFIVNDKLVDGTIPALKKALKNERTD